MSLLVFLKKIFFEKMCSADYVTFDLLVAVPFEASPK